MALLCRAALRRALHRSRRRPPAPLSRARAQESLAGLRHECTTVIVAHRLSTVADASCIVVFEGGSVAESGTHAELLQRGGLYATMWARQQEGTPLGSFSQQTEVAAAAADAAVAATGARLGMLPHGGPEACSVSRTTSVTMTADGRDDEEDEEDEEVEGQADQARAGSRLQDIAEEAPLGSPGAGSS